MDGDFLVGPKLVGLLVLARVASAKEDEDMATGIYRTLISMPCHGGHFVRAVARRELATL